MCPLASLCEVLRIGLRLTNFIQDMKKNKNKKAKKSSSGNKDNDGIKPFGDRILIHPFSEDEVSGEKRNHYGIIIPDTVSKEKSAQGKVLAVGEGKLIDGKLVPIRVKVGDMVVFSKYGYDEVEYKGEELYLLKEESILAVIK